MPDPQGVTVILDGAQYEGTLLNGFVHVGRSKVTYGTRTGYSSAGKSIQETIWDELDDVMDLMMESGQPNPADYSFLAQMKDDAQQYGKWQGIAEALCLVICLFENPHHPDINSVKGEAVLRYKRRQAMPPELTSIHEEAPSVDTQTPADSSSGGVESVPASTS